MKHYSYPSIEQFKSAIRKVTDQARYQGRNAAGEPIYNQHIVPPTLSFVGSTKLHGTNFAMGNKKSTGETWFQSREHIITPEADNAGSARYFSQYDLSSIFNSIEADIVVIYGEWCGKGIQKNVGISQLEKRLVVFDVYLPETDTWLTIQEVRAISDPTKNIYNIYDYATWDIIIDFSVPALVQNKLIEITTSVGDCCPVAQNFGVDGVGEGVVWRCVTTGYEDPKFRFKVKDDRHSTANIHKLPKIDDAKLNLLMEVAEKVTPAWRLEQIFDLACDTLNGGKPSLDKIPVFLKKLAADIIKEESDILADKGITYNDIVKYVVVIGRNYFIQKERAL